MYNQCVTKYRAYHVNIKTYNIFNSRDDGANSRLDGAEGEYITLLQTTLASEVDKFFNRNCEEAGPITSGGGILENVSSGFCQVQAYTHRLSPDVIHEVRSSRLVCIIIHLYDYVIWSYCLRVLSLRVALFVH